VALRSGARGDEVEALQKALNEHGANLEVDGVFGPATEAAVRNYQKGNDLAPDGVAGTKTLSSLGLSSGASGGGSELLLNGDPQLWYNTDTKEWSAVYIIAPLKRPDGTTTEELYISWTIESKEDLEAVVGVDKKPTAAWSGSTDEWTKRGVVNFGGVDEFRRFPHIEYDPFNSWVADMERLAISRPWILDPEWHALTVMAVMERDDGQLTIDEMQSTEWWRSHSDTERAWMELVNGDPATADNQLRDNRNNLMERLRNAGVANITDEVGSYMADMVTMGSWTNSYLTVQIDALADPYSSEIVDQGLFDFMKSQKFVPDRTQDKESDVRDLLNRWLGPVYGAWDSEAIAAKAGDFRNNPDAETNFIEELKGKRLAMFPGNDNREVSYQDLAEPWKAFGYSIWGQQMDETDPMFLEMISNNDQRLNGKLLQQEGLSRDVGKVVTDTRNAITTAFGGSIA
jgi:hypothetical protein